MTMPRQLLPLETDGRAHTCVECATELEIHEGPPHARGYEFAALTIAAALVAVGNGSSYLRAARTARVSSDWARQWRQGRTSDGANGTMVADWVGLFGPVICDPVLGAEEWPAVIALDDVPFIGSRVRQRAGKVKQSSSWVVFGAYANPAGPRDGYLFRLGASPRLDSKHAAAWLRSIPGRPRIVVRDASSIWAKAVAEAWPDVVDADGVLVEQTPRLISCEYHLVERLRSQLRASSILPPRKAYEPEQETKVVPRPAPKRKLRVEADPATEWALEPAHRPLDAQGPSPRV